MFRNHFCGKEGVKARLRIHYNIHYEGGGRGDNIKSELLDQKSLMSPTCCNFEILTTIPNLT